MSLKITNEDCMQLMSRYEDASFNICIIDPPYGTLNCKWDDASNLEQWLTEIYRVLKPDGTLICFGQQPMFSRVVAFMGKRFSHELIWEKTQKGGFVNANKMPLRAHENIAVSKVETAVYYNPEKIYIGAKDSSLGHKRKQTAARYQGYSGVKEEGFYVNDGTRYQDSFLKFEPDYDSILLESNWNGAIFGNNTNATIHPTQKPVALYKRLLKLYAKPGALVLDCFLGSGSIAIACADYNYDLVACELDTSYYEAAMKRIANHTQQLKLF